MAHGAGGRLVAGAVKLSDNDDSLGALHPGEVVELSTTQTSSLSPLIVKLDQKLHKEHLKAVPLARLMHDAGRPA
jgi:hypothetical protein